MPIPISINSNIAFRRPFLMPRKALKAIRMQKRTSITILRTIVLLKDFVLPLRQFFQHLFA